MFGSLLPRQTSFFDYFDEHAALTAQGIQNFIALCQPGADIKALAKKIKELESATDEVTHKCVAALHKTFITPLDRDAIYHLITRMDDIIDNVEATAERIVLYELHEMRPEAKQMSEVLADSLVLIKEAVGALRSMKNADRILKLCVDINGLENQGDALLRSALARLFREEKDTLIIIKWKEIFEYLESANDRCEDVAQIIEGVVLEHA